MKHAVLMSKKSKDAIEKWSKSLWIDRLTRKFIKENIDVNDEYENNFYNLMQFVNKLGSEDELDKSLIPQLGTLVEALYINYNNNKERIK